MVYIYGLVDPITKEIRYIGKTCNLRNRLRQHLAPCELKDKTHKVYWIKSLLRIKMKPTIATIETLDDHDDWSSRERYWISFYRSDSKNLTNCADGGEGYFSKGHKICVGRKCSEETKKRISLSNLGRKCSEEARNNIRLGHLGHIGYNHGRSIPEETRRKISLSLRGRPSPMKGRLASIESKKKMRLAQLGRRHSDETKKKMSTARKLWHLNKKLQD